MPTLKASVSPQLLNLMVDGAASLGVVLSQRQKQQFEVYLAELIRWNRKINLTSITDGQQIVIKHFLDSLAYLRGFKQQRDRKVIDLRVIDLGSGAGFPGLPLKLIRPELQLTLMDARFRRVVFLTQLCQRLKVEGVRCLHGRAEELATELKHYQQYNVVVVRALTQLHCLIPLAFPYIVPGGKLVVSYGPQVSRQLEQAKQVLGNQGGSLEMVAQVKLPFSNLMRNIVVIKKCFT